MPSGSINLSNTASVTYTDFNQWSSSASGSNTAKGPNATINSNSQAQVNTAALLYGSLIIGAGAGQSYGTILQGKSIELLSTRKNY